MKSLLIFFFVFLTIQLKSQFTSDIRKIECIDLEWKFLNIDVFNGEKINFDDSEWRTLNLPHDWSVEGVFDNNAPSTGTGGYLPTGIGWYRKKLTIPESFKDKKVFLQFDGVYMNSDVWINEHHLGRYPYGYATFYYDVTQYVKFSDSGTNTISVRVDNSLQPSSRWYNGAGIYRHVWLIVTSPLHIEQWGVTITTPKVTPDEAEVDIKTGVTVGRYPETIWSCWELDTTKNTYIKKTATLITKIIDGKGNVVGEARDSIDMPNFTRHLFEQKIFINSPNLWSPESPWLYKVHSMVSVDNKIVDNVLNPLGIRKLEYNNSKGFLLNDIQIKMKGVCLHHDAGLFGSAVPEKIWIRKLKTLKEMGCNAVRTSHCPFNPEFYDLCDSMGILVLNEAFDEWNKSWDLGQSESPAGKSENGYHKYFRQWFETDLRNFIRRDKNHPCVVLWSVGNEIPEQYYPDGDYYLKRMVSICHEEDPSRPVTVATEGNLRMHLNTGFLESVDIMGSNYIDLKNYDKMYDPWHLRYPEKLILGTETFYSLSNWLAVRDNDYVIGQFLWVGTDYLGESQWPYHGWNKGLIDICGYPKPEYYYRKSLWNPEPMVYLTVDTVPDFQLTYWDTPKAATHWNWVKNSKKTIRCYTNCDEAELFLNGKSLGSKKLADFQDFVIKWEVPFQSGSLKVTGKIGGKKVTTYELKTALTPERILLRPDTLLFKAGSESISIIEVKVVDRNGILIPEANDEIKFLVEGAGTLLATSNGNLADNDQFRNNLRKANSGLCLAIVKIPGESGTVKITASSGKLRSAEVTLEIK